MRTIELKIYAFNELSETAKEKAIENHRQNSDDSFFYANEIIESVKKLCELFNLRIGREYTNLNTSHIDNSILELKGVRLYKYIINNFSQYWTDSEYISKHTDNSIKISYFQYKYNCLKFRKSKLFICNNLDNYPLTGVCYDIDIMQPIIDFLKKPNLQTTFEDLICEIESAISQTFADNEEWVNSDDFIIEHFEANEYEFTEDGQLN